MPRISTFPTLYNNALQISITKLKEWGYLNPNQLKEGTITWSRDDVKRGSIAILVYTKGKTPFIVLKYKYGDESREYKVNFSYVPSNLGNGVVWYFLCPKTNKRCRKLYSIDGYFLHREAFSGCMYETQTQSKKWRQMEKLYGAALSLDNNYDKYYELINKKYFKKTYAGKPTKRYSKLKRLIEEGEKIPVHTLERLMVYGI